MTSNYRRGADFERRVMVALESDGFTVFRSAGSRSPIDLIALKTGLVVTVQCKRHGALPPAKWNELWDVAQRCGAVPVLAEQIIPRGRRYWRLTGPKTGLRGTRQPMVEWLPDQLGA